MEIPGFSWDTLKDLIIAIGWTKGVFAIFFFMMWAAYLRQVEKRVDDKQKEIDRLIVENEQWRDRFTSILDNHYRMKEVAPKRSKAPKQLPEPENTDKVIAAGDARKALPEPSQETILPRDGDGTKGQVPARRGKEE